MPVDGDRLRAHGELCLTLARAFLPPTWDGALSAISTDLPDDVSDFAAVIGIEADDDLRRFRAAVAGIADPQSLLVHYSQLFLSPPIPAPLNAGLYLDGAIDGASVQAMEKCYRCNGVERADRFKDLSDHLSVQLEFVGMLLGNAADRAARGEEEEAKRLSDDAAVFAGTFIQPWLPDLAERTVQTCAARGYLDAYGPLLRIVQLTLGGVEALHRHAPPASRTGSD
jgi:TorA maturation chaperone TorD